jgi:O-antigen ligase
MRLWPDILLVLLGGILTLRLVIWQFFNHTEVFFREDFSNLIVSFVIVLLGIFWLLQKIRRRQSFVSSGLELPIFAFIIAATASLLVAPDFASSLKGVLVLGTEMLFFFMLRDVLNSPSRLNLFLKFLLGMAAVVAVYGIITFFAFWAQSPVPGDLALEGTNRSLYYLLVHHRAVSFLGWPNVLAGYLLLFIPLAIIFPFYLKNTWARVAAFAGLFVIAVCFLYTVSFLGWLSFFISTALLLPFLWQKLGVTAWSKEQKRMLVYGFLALFILFILVILRKNFLSSLLPRLFYYKAALTLLSQNPLTGYGWNSFGILCRPLIQDVTILSIYVHNSYLQIWLETGMIGFLAISLLMVKVFRQAKKGLFKSEGQEPYWFLVAIVWGLLAFVTDNFFSFTILAPNVALFWWTMLAVFSAMLGSNRHSEQSEKSVKELILLRSFALLRMTKISLFILLVFILFIMARILGGYILYDKAMNDRKPGSFTASIALIERAEILDPWSSYLPVGAANIHLAEYRQTGLKNFLGRASGDYLEAIERSPKVYYNYFALGKIYGALGDAAREKSYTQRAKELSPAEYALDNKMFMSGSK